MKKETIKNVLKIFLIILFVVIIFLLLHTIRNFVIIGKLQKNVDPYLSKANYHI